MTLTILFILLYQLTIKRKPSPPVTTHARMREYKLQVNHKRLELKEDNKLFKIYL